MEIDLIAYFIGAWVIGYTASYKILVFKKLAEVSAS